jgi:uncharacterized protein
MRSVSCISALAVVIGLLGCVSTDRLSSSASQDFSIGSDHPFAEAVKLGHSRAARVWLARGQDPNTRDGSGTPVLNIAAFTGQSELVQDLLSRGADVNATDRSGTCALIQAAKVGAEEIAKALLAWGARVDRRDSSGATALIAAARAGAAGIVKMLLESGADVDDRDPCSCRPEAWYFS